MKSIPAVMKNPIFLGVLLVLVAAVSLRVSSLYHKTPEVVTSDVPAFMSATVASGDALKGLGPEWTFLRQTDLTSRNYSPFAGVAQMRESVVKRMGQDTQLLITELNLINKDTFEADLASRKIMLTKVAGRDGYVVPASDISGGTSFALIGSTTVLMVQQVQSSEWFKDLDPAVASYIATVRVP